jgi:signal transduction histidine kinase
VPALAAREIARLEEALAEAEQGLAALAPDGAGRRRPVEVAALLADLLRTMELPPGVAVRRTLAPGLVVADEARLRRALAEVLREAAAAMPSGGELSVGVARRGADLVVEVVDTGARAAADGATLARALLVEQGGRLEQVPVPGRGTVCRIALPAHCS